ncbi:iron-containing alcohol dehydrogenase family protein, partial [Escherichia coli]|nr:iron-containing alcohol dehydrogenase family protein [Escherichia coli]
LVALFCIFLRGDLERFVQLARCLHRHWLSTRPVDLGLTETQFVDAVAFAPRTRPDRYTILEHLALSADDLRTRLGDYVDALREHLG